MTTDESELVVKVPRWLKKILKDDTDRREFYITKGLGAGGTYALAIWHYHMCLINSEVKFSWSIAPTFQQVQDTLIPTFGDVLQNLFQLVEGEDYDVITSGRPRIILHDPHQEIHFKSANRADRFVGPSISHISMTEPGLCQQVAFEKASARWRHKKAARLQKFYEGTPEGLGNHWERLANFDEGLHPERNAIRVKVSTATNKYVSEGYADSLVETYSYDPAKLESYLHGNFVPFQKGTAYWNFHESRNVEANLRPSPYLPLLFCWDFGRSPLAWVTMQRQAQERNHIRRDRFCALSESSGNSRGMMDAIVEFIVQYPPEVYKDTPIHVYGDASGYALSHKTPGCDYDQIQQYLQGRYNKVSIEAARKAPEIRNRLERVNSLFAHDLFVVSNQCTNLIRGLTLTNLKDGTWKQDKPKDADYTHYPDAVGYPLFQLTKDTDLEKPEAKHKFGTNR
jgi:hypothetical protein